MDKTKVVIRRPRREELSELHEFFRTVLEDTFQKEGIPEDSVDLAEELEMKKAYLDLDIESGGSERYFLVAEMEGNIIGTMEFGKQSSLLAELTKEELRGLPEMGTAFVHPAFQGSGLASMLLHEMEKELRRRSIREYCLDSGYRRAQKIWTRKFGPPDYVFEDYWADGVSHMVWRVPVQGEAGQNIGRQ